MLLWQWMWRNEVNAWLNWGWKTFWSAETTAVGSGFFVQETANHQNVFSFLFYSLFFSSFFFLLSFFFFFFKALVATDRKRLQDSVSPCWMLYSTLWLTAPRCSYVIYTAYSFIDFVYYVGYSFGTWRPWTY